MRHRILTIVMLLTLVFAGVTPVSAVDGTHAAQATCEFPFSRVDATGTEVTVSEEPQRIVTLAPSAAQTMWEIGGKSKVVGVTQYALYLDGAEKKVNVSGAGESFVDVEKVVGLEPDLVLAPDVVANETVAKLRKAGLTVYKFPQDRSIDDVYRSVSLTGRLTGECGGAAETVSWMKDRIGTVERAVEGEERPDVLYVFFGYTAGKGTFINEIIEVAGGNNVAADAGITGYAKISDETVIEHDPEWLVLNTDSPKVPEGPAYQNTYAVKHDQVVVLNTNYLNQAAPRIVYPITTLAEAFHPDAYAAANASASASAEASANASTGGATSTQEPTASGANDGDAETTATDTSTPGFGLSAAAIALIGASMLALRRR